jgi:hypothetical protein
MARISQTRENYNAASSHELFLDTWVDPISINKNRNTWVCQKVQEQREHINRMQPDANTLHSQIFY